MFLRRLYQNYFKHKLFNELFLTYSVIFIIAILILAGLVAENVSLSLQKKEWAVNEQVVNEVYADFEKNLNLTEHISRQLVLNPSFRAGLTSLITSGYFPRTESPPPTPDGTGVDATTGENGPTGSQITPNPKSATTPVFTGSMDPMGVVLPQDTKLQEITARETPPPADNYEAYFHTLLINHDEIASIEVYSPNLDLSYRFTRGTRPNRPNVMVDRAVSSKQKLIPAHPAVYLSGQTAPLVYTVVYDIQAGIYPNTRYIGKLAIDYLAAATGQSYSKYRDSFHGNAFILATTGEVIFDSSAKYYGTKYPYVKKLTNTLLGRKLDVRSIISANVYDDMGVVVAAVTPKTLTGNSTEGTRWTIYMLALICIVTVLILTSLTISTFSRRIGLVMEGLRKVREGDLAARIPVTGKRDEISEIASSFNTMCDEVNRYIQQVYISEISQKTAELKALQAQINPHFLYNTLEAIRMRAVSKGVHEVGDMIYLLSELFRNSIKGEMIVSLDEELKHCRMYLELFNIRYMDKLAVNYDIAGDLARYAIPKHTLQPIIENYIKYGIDIGRDDNRLNITLSRYDQNILITIADNGQGIQPARLAEIQNALSEPGGVTPSKNTPGGGLGLVNVHQRIKIIFGPEYGIDIYPNEARGTVVTLKIPAKTREELREHVQSISG